MGTTRIKVIDLSSDQKEIKTARKHAEKLTGAKKRAIKTSQKVTSTREAPQVQETVITQADIKQGQSVETELQTPGDALPTSETKTVSTISPVAAKKPAKAKPKGHKYILAKAQIDLQKIYSAKEALEILPKISYTKFDPTVEMHLSVVDKNVKAQIDFPNTIGPKKEKKYLVFSDQKPDTSNQKLQIIWGSQQSIEDLEAGKLKPGKDFDVVIATSKFMPQLAKVAKILGPMGLMPNPKNGTVAEDIQKALEAKQNDLHEFKQDPSAPIIHTKIGKLSLNQQKLLENFKAVVNGIGTGKIKKVTIATTMSPSIKVDFQ